MVSNMPALSLSSSFSRSKAGSTPPVAATLPPARPQVPLRPGCSTMTRRGVSSSSASPAETSVAMEPMAFSTVPTSSASLSSISTSTTSAMSSVTISTVKTPTSSPAHHGSSSSNRVWVKQSAIDAATGKNIHRLARSAAASPAASVTNDAKRRYSFSSTASGRQTPTFSPLPGGMASSNQAEDSFNDTMSVASSCINVGGSGNSNNILGRERLKWGWKVGILVETSATTWSNSPSNAASPRGSSATIPGGQVVIRLLEEEDDPDLDLDDDDDMDGDLVVAARSSKNSNEALLVRLPSQAWTVGDVVWANEYPTHPETGNPQPPHDLITLTHLHEPSVVESLQYRYQQEWIYTNTGPVLLALNPFKTVRGMYGETIQKKYWERAERKLSTELPPHVYAIADHSFRSMMRALEDALSSPNSGIAVDATATSTTTTLAAVGGKNNADAEPVDTSTRQVGPIKCNQSILVSGESGAGKTVTAKFVMKYLAALSQRSSALVKMAHKRAYQQVAEQKQNQAPHQTHHAGMSSMRTAPNRMSPRKTKAFEPPSWSAKPTPHSSMLKKPKPSRVSRKASGSNSKLTASSSNGGNNSSCLNELASVTLISGSSGNSIEAQVLQSNPILESFGNARTVRNDNSSRFGKFIEIQFTGAGQLVGAQIETYLLEKVRLVTQAAGERNFHVFFEMLSGAMDPQELSRYYLAPTATPMDFRMTCSGTYDRRDGVSDRETYHQLRQAMNTMNFPNQEIRQIQSVVAAILHASNLTFVELQNEECQLNKANIHLPPVCDLLGVSLDNLNQALCYFSIQAGRDSIVQRSLNHTKAEKGLEGLLKAVYGALFHYLVMRINDSITYKDKASPNEEGKVDGEANHDNDEQAQASGDSKAKPAASIGVLDIFGFESFSKNSFEQLCINYCNEALQQQFNAFVLKNEQAEYEREGIEWSFIEFPENQEVLDLIEKRGVGILSILDDQCRAPGPSDKAFAMNVYNTCKAQNRFSASRKQTAHLQFSVQHYAGPVEYSSDGFTEKNRDELPKESIELLKNSEVSFIRDLASIIEHSHEITSDGEGGSSTSRKLHRADSTVGRATVGGQFRRQLRDLRQKIDLTSPHYIRCLKPNDLLIPDHFDTGVVAEQLRCGGILEAVRVARAGFTQHYPHADFVRRYRALAWRELTKVTNRTLTPNSYVATRPTTYVPVNRSTARSPRNSNYKGRKGGDESSNKHQVEMSAADAKNHCVALIKVLYKKLQQDAALSYGAEPEAEEEVAQPVAKARTYSIQSSTPSWARGTESNVGSKNGKPPTKGGSIRSSEPKPSAPTATTSVKKPAGQVRNREDPSMDYTKAGIQMGCTKVFLRHKAFEALERIRSRQQTLAATKLNAMFRRYLARLAYLPYRNAFRQELRRKMLDDFKESKEPDFSDFSVDVTALRFRNALTMHVNGGAEFGHSLVDKWMESRIRDAIHNPVPRHQWGQSAPSSHSFKWVLSDGIWTKNYSFQECDQSI